MINYRPSGPWGDVEYADKPHKKTYADKLKDPRWQKKRLLVLERDGWECQYCGAKDKTLHVHHKKYNKGKPPWEIDDKYLITACEECHENEKSGVIQLEKDIISLFKEHGLDSGDLEWVYNFFEHSLNKYGPERIIGAMFVYCRDNEEGTKSSGGYEDGINW